MTQTDITRRKIFKIAGALSVLPLVGAAIPAQAAQNAGLRAAMKYQATPSGDKKCSTCMHFVPGADAKALGGCKIFPGDTEISPEGYCTAWAVKK